MEDRGLGLSIIFITWSDRVCYCVVPLRKELGGRSSSYGTTQRTSHPQHSQVAELDRRYSWIEVTHIRVRVPVIGPARRNVDHTGSNPVLTTKK
jgi:hypothetical protein